MFQVINMSTFSLYKNLKLLFNIGSVNQFRLKSYYITTPIFYVNASPHIGHLYTATMADTCCRWKTLKGLEAKLVSGTDEHGLKVLQAAEKNNQSVDEYCSKVSQSFKNLYSAFNINCHDFIRTTENRHKIAVQNFWNVLFSNGFIYKDKYEGWYSTSDETFVSSIEVKEVEDKELGSYHIHVDSGNRVEWTEEVNYKFKLSLFTDKIREWIEEEPDRIAPPNARQFVLSLLTEPLRDVSISRDKNRVSWGIDVPNDPSQTVYVWLDALVNYLTACGYPDETSLNFSDMWPPDAQVVGIDIVKFHALYWPAFLMAAGLELPKQILVHYHWTIDNVKMSKSKGNVIDPMQTGKVFTNPGLRYFLLRHGVLDHNCNYNHEVALNYINADLANDVGNCLYRVTNKHLNPSQLYPAFHEQVFAGKCVKKQFHAGVEEYEFVDLVRNLPDVADGAAEEFRFFRSLVGIGDVVRASNMLIQRHTLWRMDRDVPEQRVFADTILHCSYEGLRVCGILLQPFVPDLADQLLVQLGIPRDKRSWADAKNSLLEFDGRSEPLVGTPLGERKMLFKRLKKV